MRLHMLMLMPMPMLTSVVPTRMLILIQSPPQHMTRHRSPMLLCTGYVIAPPDATSILIFRQGQGAGQQGLAHFCSQTTVDIIPLAFINVFPGQGNGWPGDNFGNQCWGGSYVFHGPGGNPSLDQLQSECPQLVVDVPVCQSTYGKKIILSLGGATATYQLTGAVQGVAFADFLWGAFGPQNATWVAKGLPRPFDSPGLAVEVDGFDFDIEYAPTGKFPTHSTTSAPVLT